jgi:KaiC/GvpD/RAD55 family RecA-like ATPase
MSANNDEGRCRSGVIGLDEILQGGIPRGGCVLVAGGPGSGKTIISTQFLLKGVQKFDEPGLLVTFDESPKSIRKNMSRFGWNLAELEEKNMFRILDLSNLIYLTPDEFQKTAYGVNVAEFTIVGAMQIIRDNVESLNANRVVVDGVTSLSIFEENEAKRRRNLAQLFKGLRDLGCTSLVTSEVSVALAEREHQLEEFLADGVLLLRPILRKGRIIKSILIEKMRGISHDTQPRPYTITEEGFTIYPNETVFIF